MSNRNLYIGGRMTSRLREKARNSTGWIFKGEGEVSDEQVRFLYRRPELHVLDLYLENKQYDHLPMWESNISDNQFDERNCQPKIIFPMAEIATGMINSLITSDEGRLLISNDDEAKQEQIDDMLDVTNVWSVLEAILPSLLTNGSAFVKFMSTSQGKVAFDVYNSKWCRPKFNESGELEEILIRQIYFSGIYNEQGEPVYKWTQMKLTKDADIYYDEPEFEVGKFQIPEFKQKNVIPHQLGFIQGEWLTTTHTNLRKEPDGKSFVISSLDFIDSLNYRLSKEDASVYYNLFPMLAAYGIDFDDFAEIVSENKARGMREGKAGGVNVLATSRPANEAQFHFLESALSGLQVAESFHIRNLQLMQYILRTPLLDPERVAGYAQSGTALKALYRPLIERARVVKPLLKENICSLFYKLEQLSNMYETGFEIDPGTIDESEKTWGDMFSETADDVTQKVGYTVSAVTSKLISRKTGLQHLAKNFEVKNVEEELKNIEQDTADEMENELLNFQGQVDAQNSINPPQGQGSGNTSKEKGKKPVSKAKAKNKAG